MWEGIPAAGGGEAPPQAVRRVQAEPLQPAGVREAAAVRGDRGGGPQRVPGLRLRVRHEEGAAGAPQELLRPHPVPVLLLPPRHQHDRRLPRPLRQVPGVPRRAGQRGDRVGAGGALTPARVPRLLLVWRAVQDQGEYGEAHGDPHGARGVPPLSPQGLRQEVHHAESSRPPPEASHDAKSYLLYLRQTSQAGLHATAHDTAHREED